MSRVNMVVYANGLNYCLCG